MKVSKNLFHPLARSYFRVQQFNEIFYRLKLSILWWSSELRVPTTLLIQIRCKWGILSSVIPYSSRNIFLRQQSSHQLSTMPKTHPYANEIFLQKISHLLLIYFEWLTPRKTSIFSVDQPQTPRKTHTPHIFPFNPQSATIPRGAWLKSNPNHNYHFPRRAWLKVLSSPIWRQFPVLNSERELGILGIGDGDDFGWW